MKSLSSNDLAVLWFYTWRKKSYRVKFSFIWRRYLHRAWTLKVWYDEHTEPNIWLNSSLENQQICAGKVAIMLIHYSQNVKWNSDDSFINLKLAMSISNGVRLAGWVGQQAFSEWSGDKWDLAETWSEPEEERDIPNRRRLPSMVGLLNLRSFPWRIYLFFKAFSGLKLCLKKNHSFSFINLPVLPILRNSQYSPDSLHDILIGSS